MSTPSGPKKTGHNRNDDRSPPNHCVLQSRPDLPKVAVPSDSKKGFENAFLVTTNTLQDLVETLVNGSATLKAWFALKLRHVGVKGQSAKRFIAPQWGPIWALVKQQEAAWNIQYIGSDHSPRLWGLHEPSSVGELYALAMFVLYHKTQFNPGEDERRLIRLKWHGYYCCDMRKFFLLYEFLVFLDFYCIGEGAIQIDRPIKNEKLPAWNNSRGGRMHSAAQNLQISEYTLLARLWFHTASH